jgi:arsenate reductase
VRHLASDTFESFSAGTVIMSQINQDAGAPDERYIYNIDFEETQYPRLLKDIPPIVIVITMGCNVGYPNLPCKHREDWGIDDPTGKTDEAFINVIRVIEQKVIFLKDKIVTPDFNYS